MNHVRMPRQMRLFLAGVVAWLAVSIVFAASASAAQTGWEALKQGTAFVVMRHALAPGTGDPQNFQVDDCSTQRNLSDVGRQQARQTGDLFRDNGITAAEVWSSAWCRCLETARLMNLGEVGTLEPLNSFFRRQERREPQTEALKDWLKARQDNRPLLLVTHQVNITALTGIFPRSGELIFVQPSGDGALTVIDRTLMPY